MDKKLYSYYLPNHLLAQKPAVPRDNSKIFVYNTKNDKIIFDKFLNIDRYLPSNSFLVLNNTRVLPARIVLKKENGGKIKVLFFVNEVLKISDLRSQNSKLIRFLVDKKINIGEKLYFDNSNNFLEVIFQEKNIFTGRFYFSTKKFYQLLRKYGEMPIPLYLRKTPLKKDDLFKKYQTIFARSIDSNQMGSIAAPTASLHFTSRVFKKLEKKGIKRYFITLHVGMGTFAPVNEKNIKEKKLHEEYYEIDRDLLRLIKTKRLKGEKLVAVGTTVVRSLESVARHHVLSSTSLPTSLGGPPSYRFQKQVPSLNKTSLFIFPPFDFKLIDILITNFHLPESSLMMLVEAFLQYKGAKKHLVELYNIAIKNNFRFYSFGDSMIIL